MAELDYVRDYFTSNAEHWVANAYHDRYVSRQYPLGNERVWLALEAVLERLGGSSGHVLDLGCGGGHFCFEAAQAGLHATGIDIAPGMIDLCNRNVAELANGKEAHLAFQVGSVVETGLPPESFDAAVALGLIEYLPEDSAFLFEVSRLLKPGGVFVVSCRNRFFNLYSQNSYTKNEIKDGNIASLLAEYLDYSNADTTAETFHAFLRSLKAAIPALEQAIQNDLAAAASGEKADETRFAQNLRQHTPQEIIASADQAGLADPAVIGIHPHPFHPACEGVAPYFFNTLARTLRPFADQASGLLWSSCFQVAFTKRT